ncbi:MAG TPA: acetyl-CoA carboxylase biotin carboxyl carrier protein [Candidatus Binataceae bacterium]|nr:acetyl-CoA carboxylase biotin carboxyl carrier protein [Candidatus Binataceae bacterium]
MEVREIKALVALMNEFGLIELEIEDKKGKVRLVRADANNNATAGAAANSAPVAVKPQAHKPAKAASAAPPAKGAAPAPELAPNQRLVQSPMVGTFYRRPSPESAMFVVEGDTVRKGQPLCIIEAMKMMNEIEAETAGRVIRILCDNGQPVEYEQPLMILETE